MNLKKMIFVKGIMVAAAALLLFACKPEPVKVNGVTLNHKTLTLEVGRTETLKADVTPADAENKAVKWSVDKSSIVSISEKDGICTVSAEAIGEATVTATTVDGGCTASCKVQVVMPVPVDGVFVKPKPAPGEPPIFIQIGNTREFTAAVTPENATNKKVTWTAEPAEAVELTDNENGSCTVKGMEAGPVTLKATSVADSSISDSVMLQVRPVPVTGIELSPSGDFANPFPLSVGKSETFTATVQPENATNKKVLWYLIDANTGNQVEAEKASVTLTDNGNGTCTVTGTKEGSVIVRAKSADNDEVMSSVRIQVTIPVTGIAWTDDASGPLKLRIIGGGSYVANVRVLPENATNKKLTYSVGTEGIIEVTPGESSFVLKGKSQGSTTFTVTTEDGNFSVTRDVNVVVR